MPEILTYIFEKFGAAEGVTIIVVLVIGAILWKSKIKINISLEKTETK